MAKMLATVCTETTAALAVSGSEAMFAWVMSTVNALLVAAVIGLAVTLNVEVAQPVIVTSWPTWKSLTAVYVAMFAARTAFVTGALLTKPFGKLPLVRVNVIGLPAPAKFETMKRTAPQRYLRRCIARILKFVTGKIDARPILTAALYRRRWKQYELPGVEESFDENSRTFSENVRTHHRYDA